MVEFFQYGADRNEAADWVVVVFQFGFQVGNEIAVERIQSCFWIEWGLPRLCIVEVVECALPGAAGERFALNCGGNLSPAG